MLDDNANKMIRLLPIIIALIKYEIMQKRKQHCLKWKERR